MKRWLLLAFACLSLGLPCAAAEAACILGKFGELPVTMIGLTPTVPLKVNGVDVRMIADSGAFFSLLTPQAARRIKLNVTATLADPEYVEGLGGIEQAGIATANDFTILGMTLHHADFLVAAPQLADEEVDGLLGDNILSYADVEFDLANGAIRLFKPNGCPTDVNLAYWARGGAVSSVSMEPAKAPEFKIIVHVQVNGHDMRAILDSGAGRSFITRRAAKAIGVPTDAPGVKPAGAGGGIGQRSYATWIAPFQSFKIGDEEVKFIHLRIGDADLTGAEMLIGADFLLSHRVYVANSEHKLYYSYIGGPVFNLDEGVDSAPNSQPAPSATQAIAAPGPAIPGAPTDQPVDAEAFSRRGSAFLARHDYTAAIADFSRAAELAPAVAQHFYDRGMARLANRQEPLALSDFDQALKLKPDDVRTLMIRGQLRLAAKDEAGGRSDLDAATRIEPTFRLAAAITLIHADLFEPAVADLDAWIADNPKDPNRVAALNERCWARALWGHDLDSALDDCNAALKLRPQAYDILDSRGLVNLRLGHVDKALADYDAVLRQQPKVAWSLYGRGLAEVRLGKATLGEADIAAATALDPGLPEQAKRYGIGP